MTIGLALSYWLSLLLAALLMGTSFAHTLEMPPKMRVNATLWTTLQHTLYPQFAKVGGAVEMGAIVLAIVVCTLVRGTAAPFHFAVVAAMALLVAFFGVWLGVTQPVNARTARWDTASVPNDWARWRSRWEYSHVTRFVLHLIAFGSLVLSLLSL